MWILQRGPATIGLRVLVLGIGADRTCAPRIQLANDGVVVGGEPAGLDFGLEIHRILLWVQMLDVFGA